MSATRSDDEKSVSEVAVAKVRNVQGTLISAPPPRCFVAKKNDDDFELSGPELLRTSTAADL